MKNKNHDFVGVAFWGGVWFMMSEMVGLVGSLICAEGTLFFVVFVW